MKKQLLTALAATLALALPAAADRTDITLLLVSDVYKMEGTGARGGFARMAAVAREYRSKGGHLLYIHSGDTLSPSLMSSIDQGEHIIKLLNSEPPDIFVPGNHEFDFGPATFRTRILQELNSKIFAANLRDSAGKPVEGILEGLVYEFGEVKVGVFGVITEETEFLSSPNGEYRFTSLIDTATKTTAKLREAGADLVVAVVHDSFSVDYEVMAKSGADVVLGGSDHDLNIQYNGKVAFAEPRSEGDYMIAVELAVDVTHKDDKRRVRWWPNFRIIDTANYTPAADTAALVASYEALLDKELGETIGTTSTALDTRRAAVRGAENAFANLMADAIREFADADVGITNGGGIRANREYSSGTDLTRRDILNELPFGNSVVKLQVTGAQLRAALENGVSAIEDIAGRFAHVSGIKMQVDTSAPAGSRLKSVMVNGVKLSDSKTYTVATNDYMAGGGDGFKSFAKAKVIMSAHETQLLATTVMEYIKNKGTVAPKVEGRIKLQ